MLVLHGPNLDRLGQREPTLYGRLTLAQIDERLRTVGDALGVVVSSYQSNWEGALIERVHRAADEGVAGIVINPAGLTHSSVSLRDALLAVAIPFVEVHLSNVAAREPFRHHSYFSDIAIGTVSGFGPASYELGLRGLVEAIAKHTP